jgi:hypothetical protein
MSRVITYSLKYPPYHPRGGESTFFVEKLCKSFQLLGYDKIDMPDDLEFDLGMYYLVDPKHTTIRQGHRFKAGDWFSPRIWSGKPYRSRQIIIGPDIQVKKTWDIEIDEADIWAMGLPGTQIKYLDDDQQARIALNDGLTEQDLYFWFKGSKKPWVGQVICWNDKINY